MLFELLRITCQISLRLYISTFHGQLSHHHLDQKVRRFSKDQKVFKKQIDLANLGLCSVEGYWCFKLVFLNLADEVHLTRYQISLLSVLNKRSMKMLYKNNVFWSVFIFRKKLPLQSGASGGAMLLLVFSVAYWPDNTEALLFIDCW